MIDTIYNNRPDINPRFSTIVKTGIQNSYKFSGSPEGSSRISGIKEIEHNDKRLSIGRTQKLLTIKKPFQN